MREVDALSCTAICLGKQGENLATRVKFRVVFEFRKLYGDGTFSLIHVRQGDEAPYPATVSVADDCVVWDVTSADVAKVGTGKCELVYTVNGVIAKSMTFTTKTLSSIGDAGEDPPEPWESWVEEILTAGAEAMAARGEWTSMSARAVTLEPGEEATASYSGGLLTLGIPTGEKGDTGEQGPQGIQGVQGPIGPQGEKGDKGDKGDQGDTGAKGDKGDKGDTGETGPQGERGIQGIQGIQGPTGPQGATGPQGLKGDKGDKGDDGDPGEGVAPGGTAGQILRKKSATDYDTEWTNAPNSAVWGGITGELEDQEDLKGALGSKQNIVRKVVLA